MNPRVASRLHAALALAREQTIELVKNRFEVEDDSVVSSKVHTLRAADIVAAAVLAEAARATVMGIWRHLLKTKRQT